MYFNEVTSITCSPWDRDASMDTKIIFGARRLENILMRRIPKDGLNTGHYWIEIIHEDEEEMDEFFVQAQQQGLKEKDFIKLGKKAKKINGFRESYGWYPISDDFWRNFSILGAITINSRAISNQGCFNGDHEDRREKDEDLKLDHTLVRIAGRSESNNELSKLAFDCGQYRRFIEPTPIKITSNPYLLPNDTRTEEQVIDEIRDYVKRFKETENEEWSWNGDGFDETNCHTLLFLILAHCNLADPECIGLDLDKHFRDYKKSLDDEDDSDLDEKFKQRKELMNRLFKISDLTNFKI